MIGHATLPKIFIPSGCQSFQVKNSHNNNDGNANDNSNNLCLITLLWGLRNISETQSAIISASGSCCIFSCLLRSWNPGPTWRLLWTSRIYSVYLGWRTYRQNTHGVIFDCCVPEDSELARKQKVDIKVSWFLTRGCVKVYLQRRKNFVVELSEWQMCMQNTQVSEDPIESNPLLRYLRYSAEAQ